MRKRLRILAVVLACYLVSFYLVMDPRVVSCSEIGEVEHGVCFRFAKRVRISGPYSIYGGRTHVVFNTVYFPCERLHLMIFDREKLQRIDALKSSKP